MKGYQAASAHSLLFVAADTKMSDQQIDLGALPLDQLSSLKQQLEEEQQSLSNNFINLREAQHRFRGSLSALSSLTPENQGLASFFSVPQL